LGVYLNGIERFEKLTGQNPKMLEIGKEVKSSKEV